MCVFPPQLLHDCSLSFHAYLSSVLLFFLLISLGSWLLNFWSGSKKVDLDGLLIEQPDTIWWGLLRLAERFEVAATISGWRGLFKRGETCFFKRPNFFFTDSRKKKKKKKEEKGKEKEGKKEGKKDKESVIVRLLGFLFSLFSFKNKHRRLTHTNLEISLPAHQDKNAFREIPKIK